MSPTLYTTYSRIAVHRKCPQRYHYAYIRKLERVAPDDVKVELEFGNWWHALRAADSIERGLLHDSLQYVPGKLGTVDGHEGIDLRDKVPDGTETLEALRDLSQRGYLDLVGYVMSEAETWWSTLPAAVRETWQERIGGALPDRLRYVDARWRERWADDLVYERPLAVELHWERDLPALTDEATGEHVDPAARMVGYVDEVYYDERRNLVVVRDHKTHKTLGTRTSAEDMMDSQLQVYAWGASPTITAWGYGPVKAVAYDRVRTTAPKQPKLTATGTLSKSVTDYDLPTYLSFAAGPDGTGAPWGEEGAYYVSGKKKGEPKFGTYHAEDSVVRALSDPAAASTWQQRTLTPLNRNIVTTHLRAAVDTSLDITATRARVAETGAAGRNLTNDCKWCPFAELCRAEMTGGAGGDYDLEAMYLRERAASTR